jgi:hypothetical protein
MRNGPRRGARRNIVRTLVGTVLLLATTAPTPAAAQLPVGDSVTGSLLLTPAGTSADFTVRYFFDARSGAAGEDPSGTVTLQSGRFVVDRGTVTCLAVNGNRASIGVSFTGAGFVPPRGEVIFVDDLGGEGEDRIANQVFVAPSTGPTICPTELPAGVTRPLGPTYPDPLFDGNVVITDAPFQPTARQQCKSGGWRNFPGFKNEGDCVSFVATGGKNEAGQNQPSP